MQYNCVTNTIPISFWHRIEKDFTNGNVEYNILFDSGGRFSSIHCYFIFDSERMFSRLF